MRLWRFTSTDEQQTADLGEALGALLRPGDLLGLDGPLGAGKTTLTRSIASGMGLDPRRVSSPTFVVVNEYHPPDGRAKTPGLAHVDAYRLSGPDELDAIDWDRLIDPASGLAIVVEWADRIADALPRQRTGRIRIEPEDERTRRVEILLPRKWFPPRRPPGHPGGPASRDERLTKLCGKSVDVTPCPITGVLTPTDSPTWPFATEQARMADLHRWFAGEYRMSREATEEDLEG